MRDLQRPSANRRRREHLGMAGAQFAVYIDLHVEVAAFRKAGGNVVSGCCGRAAAHGCDHANHSAENNGNYRPPDGTLASHHNSVYSFEVGSLSATCSPGPTPLATMILSPLLLPISIGRSSNCDPRQTYTTFCPDF